MTHRINRSTAPLYALEQRDKGSSTYYVAAKGGRGYGICNYCNEGGRGVLGVCNIALFIRLDFEFDKLSNLVVTVITF